MAARDLADWWTRVGAFLLDQLIVAGVALAGGLVAALIAGDPRGEAVRIVVYATAIPVGLLYPPLLMARGGARNGQTLGKQAVGIRAVRTNGEPMTFGVGVVRWIVGQQLLIAITFYLYALLDYLWPLGDAQNQALHDKLAKTWVVRAAAPQPPAARTAPAAPAPPPAAGVRPEAPVGEWLPPRAP